MRRIMYIENKSDGLGEGRIGWVELSRTFRTYRYGGRTFAKVGSGYKYNFIDVETGDTFWISGPHQRGRDKLYGGVVRIDEDARAEYWTRIRRKPALASLTTYRAGASTRTGGSVRQLPTRRTA